MLELPRKLGQFVKGAAFAGVLAAAGLGVSFAPALAHGGHMGGGWHSSGGWHGGGWHGNFRGGHFRGGFFHGRFFGPGWPGWWIYGWPWPYYWGWYGDPDYCDYYAYYYGYCD